MRAAAAASWALGFARSTAGRLHRGADTRTFYDVLGLPPGADEPQIKSAYRALARRFHPDVNAGDAASAERLSEINRAYETLADPEARAAYDRALARQRGEVRRHLSLLAATSAVTFLVTAAAVSLAVRWHLEAAQAPRSRAAPLLSQAEAPPAQSPMPGAVPPLPASGTPLGIAALASAGANWTTYRDRRFDFALRYPAGIFAFDRSQSDANVHTFVSRDGQATLRIVSARNTAGMTLARFRSALIRERYAGASFERKPRRRHWFALSGTRGEEVFLERVTFSCDGKSMHGWQIRYPRSQRASYDKLASLILRNHPHGNGPGAGCGTAKPNAKARRHTKRRARRARR